MAGMLPTGIDHYSYLIDRRHRPLLIGILFLLLAVASVLSEQTLERYGPPITRAENPKKFWQNIVFLVSAGLISIGIFIYLSSN
jgi:hypothetical protein